MQSHKGKYKVRILPRPKGHTNKPEKILHAPDTATGNYDLYEDERGIITFVPEELGISIMSKGLGF